MRSTFRSKDCVVFDDFLDRGSFQQLSSQLPFMDYTLAHASEWVKPYGSPNKPVLMTKGVLAGERTQVPPRMQGVARFLETVRAFIATEELPLGMASRPRILSAKVVASGVGADLDWHADTDAVAGAYVFYAHSEWHSTWGGELLTLDGATEMGLHQNLEEDGRDPLARSFAEDASVFANGFVESPFDARRMEIGQGRFYTATPNRLVLIGSSVEHRVNAVLPAAGDRYRTAIVGFFLK